MNFNLQQIIVTLTLTEKFIQPIGVSFVLCRINIK